MILQTLRTLYDTRGDEVERWLGAQRTQAAPFFTTSVDLRHSGLRLAPVDTNLFPAGFQNLSPAARHRAVRAIMRFMSESYPQARNLLIVPESHTRNLPYLDNLATLVSLFSQAGLEVRIGNLTLTAQDEPLHLTSAGGHEVIEYPLTKQGSQLGVAGFTPDLILLNNDMTSGVPELLTHVSQPIIPSPHMGWHRRHKSEHFRQYEALATAFAQQFDIDPWLICAYSTSASVVDFRDKASLESLAATVETILTSARAKHAQYGITDEPYVYIKADSGTYGMGIMTARSPEDVLEINKKERNKMQVIKEGARVTKVIVQEGIPTTDVVEGAPAEPMVYMLDGIPVGGMYRVNDQRDNFGNLNASGMRFTGMCDEAEDDCGQWKKMNDCYFRSHGIIAALAALASARETYSVPEATLENGHEAA
jgi:glutamate--cysteine ligase